MRLLFITGGSPATVFAIAPLAMAARNAGHQVFMAANENLMTTVTAAGIPAISIPPLPVQHFILTDRSGNPVTVPRDGRDGMLHIGRSFARMARASLDALLELVRDWRPDLVVGGLMSYAAPLVAARLGIPYVRHTCDAVPTADLDPAAEEELRPELRRLRLDRLPEPALFLDICPPSLRSQGAAAMRPMRFVPGNRQRPLERWMYTRGGKNGRALVTAGSRTYAPESAGFLRRLIPILSTLDLEVLVAGPEEVTGQLGDGLGDVRAGWIPIDVAASTCDLILHHGGGVTILTALSAGVPQLILPVTAFQIASTKDVADFGAALMLTRDRDTAEEIEKGCLEILSNPAYASRARYLAAEIAAQPPPAEVVGSLENLVTT